MKTGMDILGEEAQKAVATRIREVISGDGSEFDTPSDGEIYEIVMEALEESNREEQLKNAISAPVLEERFYTGWDED